jgi:hypothetical protein
MIRDDDFKAAADRVNAQQEQFRQSMDRRLVDWAHPLLQNAPISEESKANAWNAYHDSKSSTELMDKLAPLDLPNDIKHALYLAKVKSTPIFERAVQAIVSLARLDPDVLDKAEKHPVVLKHVADAMQSTKDEQ